MSSPDRSPLLPVALVLVSALALIEGIAIVILLANNRPTVSQSVLPAATSVATSIAQGVARTPTSALEPGTPVTEAPVENDLPRGAVGETVESGGFALTVLEVYDEADPELQGILDLNEDQRYIATDIVLENRSSNSFFYSNSQFKLKDGDGFEYGETLDYREPALGLGTMVHGERVRGFLSFIVPRSTPDLSLIFQPGAGAEYRTIYISLE